MSGKYIRVSSLTRKNAYCISVIGVGGEILLEEEDRLRNPQRLRSALKKGFFSLGQETIYQNYFSQKSL